MDHTHDPEARSWIDPANEHSDFPIQNLPLGRFLHDEDPHVCVGIGDCVLDLTALARLPDLPSALRETLGYVERGDLRPLMAAGRSASTRLRHALFAALREDAPLATQVMLRSLLYDRASVRMTLPVKPQNFSDFYSSIHHARRIGALVRPNDPILPNYHWLPVAYQGRTSSILPTGSSFRRPHGQVRTAAGVPEYVPSRQLDYEAELAIYSGTANNLGEVVPIQQAVEHVFGVGLLNDWSARDIQFWEYAPLGPFLGKSFATHVGDWVVTAEALAPYWLPPPWAEDSSRTLLPHLDDAGVRASGALGIRVDVLILSDTMRAQGLKPHRISTSNFRESYWTVAQLVAHLTSNGANLEPGDLLGSGTISGPTDDSRACLMEFTNGGTRPFVLPSGEQRLFVEDGDEIIMAGWCEAPGRPRIGLGQVRARVLPARR